MIYQRTMKEKVAGLYGKPIDYFYYWPYVDWWPIQEAFYYGRELPSLPKKESDMNQSNEWPFGVVSEDTLHLPHLTFAFIKHANALSEYLGIELSQMNNGIDDIPLSEEIDYVQNALSDCEENEWDEYWLLEGMMDFFTSLCPEDYYFGAHPDDGACFGYWRNDED